MTWNSPLSPSGAGLNTELGFGVRSEYRRKTPAVSAIKAAISHTRLTVPLAVVKQHPRYTQGTCFICAGVRPCPKHSEVW